MDVLLALSMVISLNAGWHVPFNALKHSMPAPAEAHLSGH